MTPKEKAIELVEKYYWIFGDGYLGHQHKQCALIAVDEIIDAYPHSYEIQKEKTKNNEDITIIANVKSNIGYWQKVKEEIEKI
ncbi:MAG: hypothetical protein ACOYMA_21355 [Bacteroidia bacterium]